MTLIEFELQCRCGYSRVGRLPYCEVISHEPRSPGTGAVRASAAQGRVWRVLTRNVVSRFAYTRVHVRHQRVSPSNTGNYDRSDLHRQRMAHRAGPWPKWNARRRHSQKYSRGVRCEVLQQRTEEVSSDGSRTRTTPTHRVGSDKTKECRFCREPRKRGAPLAPQEKRITR